MDWFLYDNGLRHERVKLIHFNTETETKSIAKLINEEQRQWSQSQKEIKKQKLAKKQDKAYHSKQTALVLLEK